MENLQLYERWLEKADDAEVKKDLESIRGNVEEINDRFYRELAFGTGGLRGVLGAGTNRMNIYTVGKATQGLANYLNASALPKKAAIGYDSRINSDVFAKDVARILAGNGIEVYLYPRLIPTPAVSWAVRYYGCGTGINITASHNPSKYNGYKVYGPDGCQIGLETADAVLAEIGKVDCFDDVKRADADSPLIHFVDEECLDRFIDAVMDLRVGDGEGIDSLKVVYTPLNGTGLECVKRIAERLGVNSLTVVPEQEKPDGHFPTCPYPNPEIREAMQKGLDLCDQVHPDILIGTDPDCDRMGAAVPDGKGGYRLITGNEMGVILLDFICKMRTQNGTMPKDPIAVTTIVSTDMVDAVAAKYGVELRRVLTGFKFIGEQIADVEAEGHPERYIFGFEESYGYLSGAHVRDKDAVNAVELLFEAAAYYARRGMTLLDAINALYGEFGYYQIGLSSYTYEGESGMAKMASLMDSLRKDPPAEIAGLEVTETIDYAQGIGSLPKANVLRFNLKGGSKAMARPSGTEPKIKFYYSAKAATVEEADKLAELMKTAGDALMK